MKKIYIAISLAAIQSFSLSSSAHAAEGVTKGHYVGVNFIDSRLKYDEIGTRSTYSSPQRYDTAVNNDIGFGLSYKYAFNYDKIFIAPGLFFDKLDASANRSGVGSANADPYPSISRLTLRNRYGVSMDLGYDLTDKISPYLTGGYSGIDYVSQNYYSYNSGVLKTSIKRRTVGDWYYGIGLRTKVTDQFSIGLEYTKQSFRAKTATNDTKDYNGVYRAKLELFKFGVFYNF